MRVITPFVGGGFGGKSASSQGIEAAKLAKLTGKPVQVAWSREEESFYDSITMGLGYALCEEIHFKGGKILDRNFDTYELPRFSRLPKIESVLIKAEDISPQGGGEPAIICMGAVIANAIHDATGARLRQLPMIPERVKQALAARAIHAG